jgi:hypothetical protein
MKGIQIRIRIRIGRPWMPIPIPQNDADPTGSGYTALLPVKKVHLRVFLKTTCVIYGTYTRFDY